MYVTNFNQLLERLEWEEGAFFRSSRLESSPLLGQEHIYPAKIIQSQHHLQLPVSEAHAAVSVHNKELALYKVVIICLTLSNSIFRISDRSSQLLRLA